jgi:hypothetical protein
MTIRNTFRVVGFVNLNPQELCSSTINSDSKSDEDGQVNIEDLPLALKNLDQLLAHVPIDRQRLIASEFVEVDAEAPVFNEWNNAVDNLLMVDRDSYDKNDSNEEDDEMPK